MCSVLGGAYIGSLGQESRVSDLMRKEGYDDADIPEVGQFIGLPPCVAPPQQCPRVELSILNQSAASLCLISLSEGGWPDKVAPMVWDAHASHLGADEKQRLTSKISNALSSAPVVDFYRRREQKRNG